jgi:hypothetical protein
LADFGFIDFFEEFFKADVWPARLGRLCFKFGNSYSSVIMAIFLKALWITLWLFVLFVWIILPVFVIWQLFH